MPAAIDLAQLRAEIDRIDGELHALIKRRAQVVVEVGRTKKAQKGVVLRPGREARILRRLIETHDGPFPPRALLAIWREIVSAAVNMQGKFSIAVPNAGAATLARDHFGAISPIVSHTSDKAALAAVTAGKASIAVLPVAGDWWRRALPPGIHVILALPAIAAAKCVPAALVVARSAPEDSGDDWTVLRLDAVRPMSAVAWRKAVGEGQLLAPAKSGGGTQVLAAIPGFRGPENSGISAPGPKGPGPVGRGNVVRGTYLGAFHAPVLAPLPKAPAVRRR